MGAKATRCLFLALAIGAGCASASERYVEDDEVFAIGAALLSAETSRWLTESASAKAWLQRAPQNANLSVFDFDHTLADTRTTIPVRGPGGNRQMDSKCLDLRSDERADFDVFTPAELLRSGPVHPGIAALRVAQNRGDLIVIITARSQVHTSDSITRYLVRFGLRPHVVVAVNSDGLRQRLWDPLRAASDGRRLESGMNKALLIMGLAAALRERGRLPESIDYHEDTDSYFRALADLYEELPQAPSLMFIDYVRLGGAERDYRYEQRAVARFREGRWIDTDEDTLEEYSSGDCPSS